MRGLHLGRGRFLSTTGQRALILGAGLLLLAFLGHAPALVLLGIVIVLLPVASVLLCGRDLGGISVVGSVDLPYLVVGGSAPLGLAFAGPATGNDGFLVTLTAPGLEAEQVWVQQDRGRAQAAVPVVGRSHGFLSEALIELEHVGLWGLASSRARAVLELPPWPIVPSTRRVPSPALPGLPVPEGDESGLGRAATSGFDPRGMRSFRAGDEPRAVNWRATARAGALTVREWDPPRQVPGVLIVPVLPDYTGAPVVGSREALLERMAPLGASESGEALLGALASLGLAAAAESRPLTLQFYGTRRTAGGADLTPPGLQQLSGLGPVDLLTALAGVRRAAPRSITDVALAAAATATRGSTVLLGLDLGSATWGAEDLLAAEAAIAAAGCRLEVVIAAPPWGLRPEVTAALATLATRCPVTPVERVVVLTVDEPVAA